MIQFPDYTCLPPPHVLYRPHKKGNRDFFDNLALTKQEKQELSSLCKKINTNVSDPIVFNQFVLLNKSIQHRLLRN